MHQCRSYKSTNHRTAPIEGKQGADQSFRIHTRQCFTADARRYARHGREPRRLTNDSVNAQFQPVADHIRANGHLGPYINENCHSPHAQGRVGPSLRHAARELSSQNPGQLAQAYEHRKHQKSQGQENEWSLHRSGFAQSVRL